MIGTLTHNAPSRRDRDLDLIIGSILFKASSSLEISSMCSGSESTNL